MVEEILDQEEILMEEEILDREGDFIYSLQESFTSLKKIYKKKKKKFRVFCVKLLKRKICLYAWRR